MDGNNEFLFFCDYFCVMNDQNASQIVLNEILVLTRSILNMFYRKLSDRTQEFLKTLNHLLFLTLSNLKK